MAGGKFDDNINGFLGTAVTTIVPVLAAGARKRFYVRLNNIGTDQRTITIWLLQTGQATTDSPTPASYGPNLEIAPKGKQIMREDFIMGPGDSLVGKADVADKVRFFVEVFDLNQ